MANCLSYPNKVVSYSSQSLVSWKWSRARLHSSQEASSSELNCQVERHAVSSVRTTARHFGYQSSAQLAQTGWLTRGTGWRREVLLKIGMERSSLSSNLVAASGLLSYPIHRSML